MLKDLIETKKELDDKVKDLYRAAVLYNKTYAPVPDSVPDKVVALQENYILWKLDFDEWSETPEGKMERDYKELRNRLDHDTETNSELINKLQEIAREIKCAEVSISGANTTLKMSLKEVSKASIFSKDNKELAISFYSKRFEVVEGTVSQIISDLLEKEKTFVDTISDYKNKLHTKAVLERLQVPESMKKLQKNFGREEFEVGSIW